MILDIATAAALVALAVGCALCVIRLLRGPTPFDRVAAFDCLVLDVVGMIVVLALRLDAPEFIDVALVVALLGFLGTVALASFLEGSLDD